MGRKHLRLLALLGCASLLSSCSLLPEEEVVRTAPVLKEYTQVTYETAKVQRGDLVDTEKISAQYVPVQKASVCFSLVGEYVDKMFVQTGDRVEAGQVLGQLQLGNLEEQIESVENAMDELEVKLAYLEQEYSLALRRQEVQNAGMDRESAAEALAELEKQYDDRRQSLNDQLSLKAVSLESLNKQLASRQVYAPFAGTVTYVKEFEAGHITVYAETAATVADSTVTLFRAETRHWSNFSEGEYYTIEVGGRSLEVQVSSEESLGLEPQEKVEGEKAYVYFQLTEPALDISEGTYGNILVELDHRTDVLHVPADAVSAAGDVYLVYYQREDGLRGYKEVEVGATIGKRTEIISGLSEGEEIIVG